MKKESARLLLCIILAVTILIPARGVFASDFGNVGGQPDSSQNVEEDKDSSYGTDAMVDYFKDFNVISSENMEKAGVITSPFVNMVGYITSVGIIVYIASQAPLVVLDLFYITIALTRKFLDGSYKIGQAQQDNSQMGMGMYGQQQAQATGSTGTQFVSDEAVKAVMLSANGTMQSAQQAAGGSFGRGFGYGHSGYGTNASMYGGAMQQQESKPNRKLAITIYFKMKAVALFISVVALFVLTSTIFISGGLNVAQAAVTFVGKYIK